MRLDFEWEEAPGVRDRILAATWARLSIGMGEVYASESVDLRSDSRRTGIYGSLFPLVEWIVEHWWHLLYEPSPSSPVPGGRAAPALMRDWIQRHNLLVARDGGALPDLTIARDGASILVRWEADPVLPGAARIRFVGHGTAREDAPEFERSLASFVKAVLTRLEERLQASETVDRVARSWIAIQTADPAEKELCRSLAILGVDPYDPCEASPGLVELVERAIHDLPEELRDDLFEGSDPASLEANLKWLERVLSRTRGSNGSPSLPEVEPLAGPTAYEAGYLTARRVRSELLGLRQDEPIGDLGAALADRLGWSAHPVQTVQGQARVDGLIGLDLTSARPLLLVADERGERAHRFRLARAAFFPVSRSLGPTCRLLTRAVTWPQRASRAFAAELLAPSAAIAERISGRLNDQDVDELATEFQVSAQVIRHQIENHGLAYLET